jgi:hypothetical protein
MSYQLSKIWHAYYDFFANPATVSQSSCKVVTILYLFCIEERILYIIYDVTINLPKNDNELSTVENLTCILWFFCKPGNRLTIQLQSSYHTIFVLHWRKNIVHNLWCYHNPTCRGYKVINCYLSVIMLQQVHDFSANLAATSQCSYDILDWLYLLYISERILYLIGDISIILCVPDTRL